MFKDYNLLKFCYVYGFQGYCGMSLFIFLDLFIGYYDVVCFVIYFVNLWRGRDDW